ncbi:hypothetical protein DLAC_08715 [Tieghemostelium lacteum]|uniref:Uncharacterized protein n=1 Tax=Tieghemostelium lacteum TaxID=361077 RepID=A0A151Z853_TIELA|nr:hypothetical protein DLAC_08715 [Tieghemostelium lacteum]|eukprot:KYQ90127.1 hypothetical protein DLAC_08715 [Tieghemostelium lacteum]
MDTVSLTVYILYEHHEDDDETTPINRSSNTYSSATTASTNAIHYSFLFFLLSIVVSIKCAEMAGSNYHYNSNNDTHSGTTNHYHYNNKNQTESPVPNVSSTTGGSFVTTATTDSPSILPVTSTTTSTPTTGKDRDDDEDDIGTRDLRDITKSPNRGNDHDNDDKDIFRPTPSYYSIRKSNQNCENPSVTGFSSTGGIRPTVTPKGDCIAYYLKKVNTFDKEIPISGFNVPSQHTDHFSFDKLLEDIVVYGSIRSGRPTRPGINSLSTFDVSYYYKALPYQGDQNKGKWYHLSNNPQVRCQKLPCRDALRAEELNTGKITLIENYQSPYPSAVKNFDNLWYTTLALKESGFEQSLQQGTITGSGQNQILNIDRTLIYLPDDGDQCQKPVNNCRQPQVPYFNRNADRCLVYKGCVKYSTTCAKVQPTCPREYHVSKFMSEDGCQKYYCDANILKD